MKSKLKNTDPKYTEPKYTEVKRHLKQTIDDGLFHAHDKMPSIRQLCEQLSVSKNTVIRAYQELEAMNIVYSQPRSGYRVQGAVTPLEIPLPQPNSIGLLSLSKSILVQPTVKHHMPAGSAHPNTQSAAIRSLYAEIGRHSRQQTHIPSHYQLPPGNSHLVKQLLKISQDLGLQIKAQEIAITHGGQQAISLAFRALTKREDIVAVESPCYFGTLLLLESLGLKVVEIPSHSVEGIDISALEQALSQWPIKAILVTPNFNNPTGSQMPLEKRKQLLAVSGDTPIIEDDVFGGLYFQKPIPCLKMLDGKGRVIYINSLSKTLDSRLRIGWIIAGKYQAQIEKILLSENMGSLNLIQSAVAEFLESGKYRQHLAKMRRTYQLNQQRFAKLLTTSLNHYPSLQGQFQLSRPEGSFLCWLTLPPFIDSFELYQRGLQNKISLLPGHLFATQGQFQHCIRFSVANFEDNMAWQESINKLTELIHLAASDHKT
ncbi:MAG: PLP-dependent aminotransferase family protein [Vibrio anguillarum]